MFKVLPIITLVVLTIFALGCSRGEQDTNTQAVAAQLPPPQAPAATVAQTPAFPNLQTELIDKRDKETISPLGKFDFKNYTYTLPRGWQNPDGSDDITLV